jgi:hypothetical protein
MDQYSVKAFNGFYDEKHPKPAGAEAAPKAPTAAPKLAGAKATPKAPVAGTKPAEVVVPQEEAGNPLNHEQMRAALEKDLNGIFTSLEAMKPAEFLTKFPAPGDLPKYIYESANARYRTYMDSAKDAPGFNTALENAKTNGGNAEMLNIHGITLSLVVGYMKQGTNFDEYCKQLLDKKNAETDPDRLGVLPLAKNMQEYFSSRGRDYLLLNIKNGGISTMDAFSQALDRMASVVAQALPFKKPGKPVQVDVVVLDKNVKLQVNPDGSVKLLRTQQMDRNIANEVIYSSPVINAQPQYRELQESSLGHELEVDVASLTRSHEKSENEKNAKIKLDANLTGNLEEIAKHVDRYAGDNDKLDLEAVLKDLDKKTSGQMRDSKISPDLFPGFLGNKFSVDYAGTRYTLQPVFDQQGRMNLLHEEQKTVEKSDAEKQMKAKLQEVWDKYQYMDPKNFVKAFTNANAFDKQLVAELDPVVNSFALKERSLTATVDIPGVTLEKRGTGGTSIRRTNETIEALYKQKKQDAAQAETLPEVKSSVLNADQIEMLRQTGVHVKVENDHKYNTPSTSLSFEPGMQGSLKGAYPSAMPIYITHFDTKDVSVKKGTGPDANAVFVLIHNTDNTVDRLKIEKAPDYAKIAAAQANPRSKENNNT